MSVKLCSLTEVQEYLLQKTGKEGNVDFINNLIERWSGVIEDYCERIFHSEVLVERLDIVDWQRSLLLQHYPVISVAGISDCMATSGILVDSANYVVDKENGIVKLITGGYFSKGLQNVDVTYTAGVTVVPESIKHCAILQVAKSVVDKDFVGVKSEKIGDYSYSLSSGGFLPDVLTILNTYKRFI